MLVAGSVSPLLNAMFKFQVSQQRVWWDAGNGFRHFNGSESWITVAGCLCITWMGSSLATFGWSLFFEIGWVCKKCLMLLLPLVMMVMMMMMMMMMMMTTIYWNCCFFPKRIPNFFGLRWSKNTTKFSWCVAWDEGMRNELSGAQVFFLK